MLLNRKIWWFLPTFWFFADFLIEYKHICVCPKAWLKVQKFRLRTRTYYPYIPVSWLYNGLSGLLQCSVRYLVCQGTYENLWRILHADNAFKMLRNYRLQGVLFQDAINSIILNFWCCSSLLYALVNESIILAF